MGVIVYRRKYSRIVENRQTVTAIVEDAQNPVQRMRNETKTIYQCTRREPVCLIQ